MMLSWTTILLCLLPILLAFLFQPLEINNIFVHGARILLVTAHPDDESYFFAPTLLALLGRAAVYSLCLSTGDADGLGDARVGELTRSLDVLGIDRDKRWVARHPNLQDNITADWDPAIIAKVVEPYVVEQRIDIIFTFDDFGVSGHPNHISIPNGIAHLLRTSSTSSSRLYTLKSVPLVAKFTSLLAPIHANLEYHILRRAIEKARPFMFPQRSPTEQMMMTTTMNNPVFVSDIRGFLKTLSAIRQHESQLVWFRWLYAAFSQYMWVNRWVEVKLDR